MGIAYKFYRVYFSSYSNEIAVRNYGLQSNLRLSRASWIDHVRGNIERMGAKRWLVYAGLIVLVVTLLHGLHWLSGAYPVGRVSGQLAFFSSLSLLCVALIGHFDKVACDSLERFQPALAASQDELRQLAARFTMLPTRPILLCLLLGLVFFLATLWIDSTFVGLLRGYLLSDAAVYLIGWLNSSMMFLIIYYTAKQLLLVDDLLIRARSISLIDHEPVFAFSTLTYHIAVVGILFTYSLFYVYPDLRMNPLSLGLGGVGLLTTLVAFFLPLQRMHNRMEEEKSQRLSAVRQQLEAAFARLHSMADTSEPGTMDHLDKQLSSLLLEEEYLRKLPTWPWPPGLFARVVSVAVLPLLLLVAQHFISRLFFD